MDSCAFQGHGPHPSTVGSEPRRAGPAVTPSPRLQKHLCQSGFRASMLQVGKLWPGQNSEALVQLLGGTCSSQGPTLWLFSDLPRDL